MELSSDEVEVIMRIREERRQREAKIEFRRKAIRVAHSFEQWSHESGYELTFSTFVNEFGYDDGDEKAIFEAIKRIREAVYPQ